MVQSCPSGLTQRHTLTATLPVKSDLCPIGMNVMMVDAGMKDFLNIERM